MTNGSHRFNLFYLTFSSNCCCLIRNF